MATKKQLLRRMHELQTEIESLRHQNESFQNEMTGRMEERISALRAEYDGVLARQKNENEETYTARIRAFQEEMLRKMRSQYSSLEQESARISKMQADKIAELSKCNEELRQLLQNAKASSEAAESNQRMYASSLMDQLKDCRNEVSRTPHEFFFKGEFDIIDSHAGQIREEIRQEMYQAASADASSVMMDFDLLRTKVEQALHEWMMAFQDYARIVRGISARLDMLESHSIRTAAGTYVMTPQELDFWSSGTYLPYKQKIQEAARMIKAVNKEGVSAYLKGQQDQLRKGIFAKVSEAQKWEDELAGITNCILSERALSDERWVFANLASKQLGEVGYRVVKKGYREPEAEVKAADWYPKDKKFRQNPLDSFEITETISEKDLLHITFVPVRDHGVALRNDCLISLTAESLKDAALTKDVIEANVRRVRTATGSANVSGSLAGGAQLVSEERRRKQSPDPREQVRYLERKYH